MDTSSLFASLVFGSIGLGLLVYGKRTGRIVPLGAGLALMVVPYLIPNAAVLLLVCCALTAAPWLLRSA